MELVVPVSWMVVPLATPVALPASSKFAAVSTTTKVAPVPTANPVSAAMEVACVAVTELAVPVSVTEASLLAD